MSPILTAAGSGLTTPPPKLGALLGGGALGWVTAMGEVFVMVVIVAAGIIRVDMTGVDKSSTK